MEALGVRMRIIRGENLLQGRGIRVGFKATGVEFSRSDCPRRLVLCEDRATVLFAVSRRTLFVDVSFISVMIGRNSLLLKSILHLANRWFNGTPEQSPGLTPTTTTVVGSAIV